MLSNDEVREVYRRTRIIRKPTYGIISGYHELPYICLGHDHEQSSMTMKVCGKVHVSPRFVIRPSHLEASYEEIFGEENVDVSLVGRVFGFMGFRGRPVECRSEHLEVSRESADIDRVMSTVLDEMERREDITTGVLITPDSRYYPISVERFIASILEDEFNV